MSLLLPSTACATAESAAHSRVRGNRWKSIHLSWIRQDPRRWRITADRTAGPWAEARLLPLGPTCREYRRVRRFVVMVAQSGLMAILSEQQWSHNTEPNE